MCDSYCFSIPVATSALMWAFGRVAYVNMINKLMGSVKW
jgi:hypothetical protein